MVEIERKFLVRSDSYRQKAIRYYPIVQGFLNTDPERTVRVRIKGENAFLTVKGISSDSGVSRFEWEHGLTVQEAEALLPLCEPGVVEKVRYEIPFGNHVFEVDEFLGMNQGLIIAEVELSDEYEAFDRPDWLGNEITGDIRYYNSQLSRKPYATWEM